MGMKIEYTEAKRTPDHTVVAGEPMVAQTRFMAPPHTPLDSVSSPSGLMRVAPATPAVSSTVHFVVHGAMPEIQAYAQARGWYERGHHVLSTPWQELHYTLDGWKTVRVLRSSDVPSPVVNGHFVLPGIAAGTSIEFAIHVGVACHAPHDTAGARDVGDVWLNNSGANFQQFSR